MLRHFGRGLITLAAIAVVGNLYAKEPDAKKPFDEFFKKEGAAAAIPLLKTATARKELDLSKEQTDKLASLPKEMSDAMKNAFANVKKITPDERKKKRDEVKMDITKKLEAILKPEQSSRLLEIIVQVDDCQMFAESNLGAFLKITDEQKTKIEEITKEKNEAIMKALGFGVDSSGEKDLEKSLKELPKKQYLVFKEANEKVEKSLTSEQRESLDKLKGKKIDLAKLFDEMAENKLDSKKSSDTAPSQPSGKPKLP